MRNRGLLASTLSLIGMYADVITKVVKTKESKAPQLTLGQIKGRNGHSLNKQFPKRVKLDDGRDRYFLKHGILVDRLGV